MSQIRVELELKDGSFVSGMLRAGQSVDSFKKELSRLDAHFRGFKGQNDFIRSATAATDKTRSMGQVFRDTSLAVGGLALALDAFMGGQNNFIGQITRVNAEMERLRYQMIGMSQAPGTVADAMKDAAENVEYLRDVVRTVPFSLNELASTFTKIKATGIDPTKQAIGALTDGIAAMGGTDEHLHRVTLGITQMSGKSVIQMEEMRQQLGESMPNAMQLMARSMGVSVTQLTAAIGTGTLEAKSSLEAFYGELDRTYGGSAQRMMETFSGQVSQVKANFQLLATSKGMAGYFNAQKDAMKEFNNFLASPAAMNFANNLGGSLQSLVGGIESAVSAFWRFREEIKLTLMVLAGVVAFRTATGALSAMGLAYTAASMRLGGFRSTLKDAAVDMQIFSQGMRVSGDRMDAARIGMSAFMRGGTAVVGMLSTWAPAIGIAGIAAYELGKHFGIFRQDVQEVTSSVAAMGAASREEAQKTADVNRKNFQIERAQIEALRVAAAAGSAFIPGLNMFGPDYDEAMADIDKREAAFESSLPAYLEKSTLNEADGMIKLEEALIAGRMNELQKAYVDRQVLLDKERASRVENAKKTGEEVGIIDRDYQIATFENQKRIEDERIAFLDEAISKQVLLAIRGTEAEAARAGIIIANFNKQRVEAVKASQQVGQQLTFMTPAKDIEKMQASGDAALAKLVENVTELRVELSGADTDTAKLLHRLERGDYGSVELGEEAFIKMRDAIIETAKEKEYLDKLLEGQKDLESDLKSAAERSADRKIEAIERSMGRALTDGEKILRKIESGDYFGFGPTDKIKEAMGGLFDLTELQGRAMGELGKVTRDDAFGEGSKKSITDTAAAIDTVKNSVEGLAGAMQGLNFDSVFQMTGGGGMFGPQINASQAKNFLDLIGLAEGTDKGRGYNEVLGYGKYGGGSSTLTNMSLKQVLDLGEMIRQNSKQDGFNSSAVGRYQIVGTTMRELMAEMKLDPYRTKFTPEIQDQMATRLMARRGADVRGLRNEWEGLRRISDEDIMRTYNGSTQQVGPTKAAASGLTFPKFYTPTSTPYAPQPGPALGPRIRPEDVKTPVQAMADLAAERAAQLASATTVREAATAEARIAAEKAHDEEMADRDVSLADARGDMIGELHKSIVDAENKAGPIGKNLERVMEAIRNGEVGSNRIVGAPENKALIELAKEADKAEATRAESDKAREKSSETQKRLEEQRLSLLEQIADAEKQLEDPNYDRKSAGMIKLNKETRAYLDSVAEANGGTDNDAYRAAEAEVNSLRSTKLKLDAITSQTEVQKRTDAVVEGMMTEAQLRRKKYDDDIAMINSTADAMKAAGQNEVEVAKWVAEQKAIIDQQYEQNKSPIGEQMKQWADMQGNLEQAVTKWTDSAATGIAGLITGTGDLRSAVTGMLNDVVNMGVRKLFANMKEGKAGTSVPNPGGGKMQKLAVLIPGIAHTGAIVGSHRNTSARPASLWSGAPRFHKGGIPLPSLGPKLLPSEVPIIARKGEGIFTPEQMSQLGGSMNTMGVTIHAPVSVNANGGTPEQNADLAKKVARETEMSMRAVVRDEIGRQFRPGAMLNKKG